MSLILLQWVLFLSAFGGSLELTPQECKSLTHAPPIYAQSEEYTCAAASLRSWLETQGVIKTEAELAVLIKTTTEKGTEASSMVAGLEELGFNAQFKTGMTLYELQKYIRRGYGVLADIQLEGEGHWVLVLSTSGYESVGVVFMDPWLARSKKTFNSMTRNAFLDVWRGTNDGVLTPRAAVLIEPKTLSAIQNK